MSSFPLAGGHSKIYHSIITNADLGHCAALVAFAQVFVRGKNGTHFQERYRLCKVQSKLVNSCHNNDAWLVKQWDEVGARFVRGLQYATQRVKLRAALPRNLLVIILLTQDLSLEIL